MFRSKSICDCCHNLDDNNNFDKLITHLEFIMEEIKYSFGNTNDKYNYDSEVKVEVSNGGCL